MKTHAFIKFNSLLIFLIKMLSILFLIALIYLYFNPEMIRSWAVLGFLAVYLFLIALQVVLNLTMKKIVVLAIALILMILMIYILILNIFALFANFPIYIQIGLPILIIYFYFLILLKLLQYLIRKLP